MTVAQAMNEPIIAFDGMAGKNYTLLMVDMFGMAVIPNPSAAELSENFLHMFKVNIPGSSAGTGVSGPFNEGDTIAAFFGPANPDTIPHDYVFYVFEQVR